MQTPVLQEEAAEPENHFSRLSGPAMMGRSAEPVRLAGVKSKLRPGQRRHVSAVHWRRTLRNRNAQEEVPEPERPQAKMPKGHASLNCRTGCPARAVASAGPLRTYTNTSVHARYPKKIKPS